MSKRQASAGNDSCVHRAVFEVLNSFSRLDHNLGMCLSHLKAQSDARETYSWLEGQTTAQKIEALTQVTETMPCGEAFAEWSARASRVRALRNKFAHGVWDFLSPAQEKPIQLRMPPWVSQDAESRVWSMSVAELEGIAKEVQACFGEFMAWRREFKV